MIIKDAPHAVSLVRIPMAGITTDNTIPKAITTDTIGKVGILLILTTAVTEDSVLNHMAMSHTR